MHTYTFHWKLVVKLVEMEGGENQQLKEQHTDGLKMTSQLLATYLLNHCYNKML